MKRTVTGVTAAVLSAALLAGSLTGCSARSMVTETVAAATEASTTAAAKSSAKAAAMAPAATAAAAEYTNSIDGGIQKYAFTNGEEVYMESATEAAAMPMEMNGGSFAESYRSSYGGDFQSSEEYTKLEENGYQSVEKNPLSTFSADVDTASYTNIRRMIEDYGWVDPDAVRIEEMINYFDYDYELPGEDEAFAVTTQYTSCPWNEEAELLLIGVKTAKIDFTDRPKNNLVFLIDVSGSMYDEDKLPLLQKSFAMLAENLTKQDRVSIVTYAGYDTVVLEGEPGNHTETIVNALNDLEAGGSTAGSAGIKRAYQIARENFIEGGNNRVILATDGDLNVGLTTTSELTDLITKERDDGIFLSVLGVGTGNLKDNKMEALADNGNGNYSYIDSIFEARKVLVEEMGGTLVTVAKDVKFQVEFNPAKVKGYRLVGYENRVLADEDFNDDSVDAGEIGAGHTVTVLYEILPEEKSSGISLKYQPEKNEKNGKKTNESGVSSELLTVSVRYKEPDGEQSILREFPVEAAGYEKELSAEASWACAVAEFGMLLENSPYAGSASVKDILSLCSESMETCSDAYREEFVQLVSKWND